MPRIHWVTRQNKVEVPRDKDEVNNREIHERDDRVHDPDTMVVPLTPKPTRKVEPLTRSPPTIPSCHEEDAGLRKWPLSRYCCSRCNLETKLKMYPNVRLFIMNQYKARSKDKMYIWVSVWWKTTIQNFFGLWLIDKVRVKDKTYIWVSVRWKTKN
jgi:hypothetical protein